MNRIGEFYKVSFKQFRDDMTASRPGFFDDEIQEMYEKIRLPERATGGSAGYDFKAPFSFFVGPGATIKVPTGIRVQVDAGWALVILPRSSMGFKYRMQLDNTVGLIDSDYFEADNEGHIFIKLTNDSKEGRTLSVEAGQAFAQGIFIPYGITYSDKANAVRTGGLGSTDNVN